MPSPAANAGRLGIIVRASDGSIELIVRNDVADGDGPDGDVGGSGLGSNIVDMLLQQMAGSLAIDRTRRLPRDDPVPLAEARPDPT